uniref:Uncharacterized protein n=1 Tax=Ditylenchus dipsaci TaxID=166011 RepID=A0A915CVR6_9BILA
MNDYGHGRRKQKTMTYWSHNFTKFVSSRPYEDNVNIQSITMNRATMQFICNFKRRRRFLAFTLQNRN